MEKIKVNGRTITATATFRHIRTAMRFWSHMREFSKYQLVMMECPTFWLVTNREASILKKAGYELVPFNSWYIIEFSRP